jgi:hypothetical protein
MNLSDTLLITERGTVEVRDRLADLDSKARSILLALGAAPRTIGDLLSNLPLERADALLRIDALLKEGLVNRRRGESRAVAQAQQKAESVSAASGLELEAGIFVSEARFLLTDFCVDALGSEADKLVRALEAANGVDGLRRCLQDIAARLASHDPAAMPSLHRIVATVNGTAR